MRGRREGEEWRAEQGEMAQGREVGVVRCEIWRIKALCVWEGGVDKK